MTVKQDPVLVRKVAVLGSGVNSLFTSLELLKRGYEVTLYSDTLPDSVYANC